MKSPCQSFISLSIMICSPASDPLESQVGILGDEPSCSTTNAQALSWEDLK